MKIATIAKTTTTEEKKRVSQKKNEWEVVEVTYISTENTDKNERKSLFLTWYREYSDRHWV